MREPHELPGAPLRHPVEHLTDNYKKNKDSNNFKLLQLDHKEHKQIWNTLKLVEAWRDMDNAEGFTLDKIGKNVLELREGREDPEFRKAIKIKIRGNLSAGTIEDLNIIADILFGENFESLSETWHMENYNFEPAAVALYLYNLSLEDLTAFERDIAFITEIVMAGGVGLRSIFKVNIIAPTDYHAGAMLKVWREHFVEETPIETRATDYHAAAELMIIKEYFAEETEIITVSNDYAAGAMYERIKMFLKEV